jgi:2,5-dihydroxypyridine 5,6-dioxygenase
VTVSRSDLVGAWRRVLDLSLLRPTETVAVLTRPDIYVANLDAALHAVADIGSTAFRMEPVIGPKPLRESAAAMRALKSVDFLIDFLGLHLLRAHEQGEIIQAGVRILYVIEPPESLVRLVPTVEDKHRTKAAEACLKRAKTMRIVSDAGTDLDVGIGEYPILCEWGYSDEPGHWDHWPAGFIATWPNEGSATGTVVLDVGDIIFPFKSYVRTPIRLKISDGYIREISGHFDADYLRHYVAEFADPEAYAISHLGWGLNPRARWSALGLLDKVQTNGNEGRAFAGNFMFSTGPNTDAGGTRDTKCHLDIPMRDCSVSLDGEPMTVRGRVVAAGQSL